MNYYKQNRPIKDDWEKRIALEKMGIDPVSAARLASTTDIVFDNHY